MLRSIGVRITLYFHDIKVMIWPMEGGLDGICCVYNDGMDWNWTQKENLNENGYYCTFMFIAKTQNLFVHRIHS